MNRMGVSFCAALNIFEERDDIIHGYICRCDIMYIGLNYSHICQGKK